MTSTSANSLAEPPARFALAGTKGKLDYKNKGLVINEAFFRFRVPVCFRIFPDFEKRDKT